MSSLPTSQTFDSAYPNITRWINGYGWIEVGQDDYSRSMIRALDAGGMVWEGKRNYTTLDDLWQDLERNLIKVFKDID